MAIRTYIAIITSHVNGLNALKDIKWLKAKLKKRILPIEDSDLKTYIYWKQRDAKGIECK